MLKNIRKSQSGFTLVEIMIVVAIIALLAAIAVPGFLRARKRSQATAILNDARILEAAKDQYAIEKNVAGNTTVTVSWLKDYIKPGTRLYSDVATNATAVVPTIMTSLTNSNYTFTTFDSPLKLDSGTIGEFSNVIENSKQFCGGFAQ